MAQSSPLRMKFCLETFMTQPKYTRHGTDLNVSEYNIKALFLPSQISDLYLHNFQGSKNFDQKQNGLTFVLRPKGWGMEQSPPLNTLLPQHQFH